MATRDNIATNLKGENHMDTQKTRVFKHLIGGRSISQLEAIKYFGAMRLSAIIHKIRGAGYNVTSIHTKDAVGISYVSYKMKK